MPYSLLLLLIGAPLLVHFVYQVYFLIGLTRIKTNIPIESRDGVSIIIAARNEIENLKRLIPTLLVQDYPHFEIIIVNDRSEDGSREYLMRIDEDPKIKVVYVDHLPDHVNSKKYALTLGIKAASFEKMLFTDADCTPASSSWVSEMVSGYSDSTQIVLGFSPYEYRPGFLNALIRFETHMTGVQYLSVASNGNPYMGVGRNLSYAKSLFFAKKGFNGFQEVTGGDDDLFVNKNGNSKNTKVVLTLGSKTLSVPKTDWKSYINQKIRHLSVGKYYNFSDRFFLGLFSLSHLLSWVCITTSMVLNLLPLLFGCLFLAGYVTLIINFGILNKKSGARFSLPAVLFVDVIYLFFYIFVAIRTVFTRKVEWTT